MFVYNHQRSFDLELGFAMFAPDGSGLSERIPPSSRVQTRSFACSLGLVRRIAAALVVPEPVPGGTALFPASRREVCPEFLQVARAPYVPTRGIKRAQSCAHVPFRARFMVTFIPKVPLRSCSLCRLVPEGLHPPVRSRERPQRMNLPPFHPPRRLLLPEHRVTVATASKRKVRHELLSSAALEERSVWRRSARVGRLQMPRAGGDQPLSNSVCCLGN